MRINTISTLLAILSIATAVLIRSDLYQRYYEVVVSPLDYLGSIVLQIQALSYLITDPAAYELYSDYSSYKNNYRRPVVIPPVKTDDEKMLHAYYAMDQSGLKFTAEQRKKFDAAIQSRADSLEKILDFSTEFATSCAMEYISVSKSQFQAFSKAIVNNYPEKQVIFRAEIHSFASHFADNLRINNVPLRELSIKSCLSRMNVLAIDLSLTAEKTVAFIVPVHREFNRLKSARISPLGEDFLTHKYRELSVLFADCVHLKWYDPLLD